MNEKETKYYKWLSIVGAVLMVAMVVFFLFWASSKLFDTNCPEIPASSTDEKVVQSKIESVKWKFKYDSVSVEYAKVMALIERKKSNSNKKIKQNEITKKQDASRPDSAVYILRDSLRSEYRKRYFDKDSIVSSRFFN